MAVHQECPVYKGKFVFGAVIENEHCYNVNFARTETGHGPCQGDGKIPSPSVMYCKGCSEHYGICEKCGREFNEEYPAALNQ